jgi:hypothetical protein
LRKYLQSSESYAIVNIEKRRETVKEGNIFDNTVPNRSLSSYLWLALASCPQDLAEKGVLETFAYRKGVIAIGKFHLHRFFTAD